VYGDAGFLKIKIKEQFVFDSGMLKLVTDF
jgi:hypothetical protein